MNCRNLFSLTFLAALFFSSFPSFAQEESASKSEGIAVFFEKVYLHTDRDYYTSGNDIWFKAYLVNGQSNYFTNTSNNLYVELISPKGELLERHVSRMEEGKGKGDFALGDSIPSGTYKLRAYTAWMRNFGDNFVFEKELKVVSLLDIPSVDPELTEGMTTIRFFPEGGALLEGVAGKLAFKAEDQSGKGVAVEGEIFSAAGESVGNFRSTHAGMGSLTIFPVPGEQYLAKGKFDGKYPFTVELPPVLKSGFSIQLMDAGPEHLMLIVNTDPATLQEYQGKVITIAGRHAGKVYFSGDVQLKGTQTPLKLAKNYFPAGIASITLYDAEKRPQCERLVYIERQDLDKVNLTVAASRPAYKTRENVVLKVRAMDQQNQPVKTHLSLAVVDETLVPEEISDIHSYLMLESEVKGKIEHPKQYFNPKNEERVQQLDLLLLTQGWRGFVWRKLREEGISIKYLPEPGITISGKVRKLHTDKPMEGVNISLFAPGAKESTMFSTQTNAEGNYFLDGLEFYGKQEISLTARDKKGKKEGWLFMKPVFGDTLTIKKFPLSVFNTTFSELNLLKKEEDKIAKVDRQYRLTSEDFLLKEVEIKGKKEKEEQQVMRHKTTLMVNQAALGANIYDFKITEEEAADVNVVNYLSGKFPNAEISDGFIKFRVRGSLMPATYFLDGGMSPEVDTNYVSYMSLRDIERIIVTGSYVSIYRREDALPPKELSRIDQMVDGYYEAREFYTPSHQSNSEASLKPDFRTTIFWEPNITTDENGEAIISFYNTDRKGKVRATIQGISEKGVPLVSESSYEVK